MTTRERELGWVPADLEWVRTFELSAETAYGALARVMDCLADNFTNHDSRDSILDWCIERCARALVASPGLFETSNPPEKCSDPARLLSVSVDLRAASKDHYGTPTLTFDPQWLMRLSSQNMDMASSLLKCCADEMPIFVRHGWLIDVLEQMQSGRPDNWFSTFDIESLNSLAVSNPECQRLIGLWAALEMDSEENSLARKICVSMAVVDHEGLANMSAREILNEYCPSVLASWPVIRGLGLGVRAAASMALRSNNEPQVATALPVLE